MTKRLITINLVLWLTIATAAAEETAGFVTDVIGVDEQHLSPDFWVRRTRASKRLLMSASEIAAHNASAFAEDGTMTALDELPTSLSGAEVQDLITALSRRPGAERLRPDGSALGDADYAAYADSLNLNAIPDEVHLRFGLVTHRADMRTFPTSDRVISSPGSADLDRFQEHSLFPGEAVAILHASADGEWFFARSYNYAAWVKADAIAIGEREAIFDYLDSGPFLVVTGSKVATNFNPAKPAISELQLDMGVRLPLVSAAETGHNVHGQNPFASYIVRLPVRGQDGRLGFDVALIARSQDVSTGYLPYTRENVIRQAFKFLGERYGWGHSYNGRDCTGFVSEIYKTFGLLMPRNSGDQGRSVMGDNVRFDDNATERDKQKALRRLQPGALIYIPGHVAMYLGDAGGEPFVIHDVAGLAYLRDDGSFYRGLLHGVSVTPLLPMRTSPQTRYLDRIYNIKTFK